MGDNMKDEEIEILDIEETKEENIPTDTSKAYPTDIPDLNNEDREIDIKNDDLLGEQNINSDYNSDNKMPSSNNKKTRKTITIIIITIIILFIAGICLLLKLVTSTNSYIDNIKNKKDESAMATKNDSKLKLAGNSYTCNDDSLIYFYDNQTFKWYKSKYDLTDNYYEGTYTIYHADEAINYIAHDLTEYGLTKAEQEKIIKSYGSDAKKYYYNLNLNTKKIVMNRVSETMNKTTSYYGFSINNNKTFNLVNINTAIRSVFTKN